MIVEAKKISREESRKIMLGYYYDMKKRKSLRNQKMMERIRALSETMDLSIRK